MFYSVEQLAGIRFGLDAMVQVFMQQGFPVISRTSVQGFSRFGHRAALPWAELGTGLAVFLLLAVGRPACLQAQKRGDLQVAARVLESQPSQLALAQGLSAALKLPTSTPQTLASIRVEPVATGDDRLAIGRRKRAVLTIAFLRN
jgi:hypothetical protein